MPKVNSRGFHEYLDTTCTYGSNVRVQESSIAAFDEDPDVWTGGDLKDNNGSCHLNEAQAREVIRSLQEFVDGIPERWPGLEDPVKP